MGGIVGPDADELLLGDIRRNRHLLIGRRPGRMDILTHRQAGIGFTRLGIHKEYVAAQEGEDRVILIFVEEQHMRTPDRLLGGRLAKCVDLAGRSMVTAGFAVAGFAASAAPS